MALRSLDSPQNQDGDERPQIDVLALLRLHKDALKDPFECPPEQKPKVKKADIMNLPQHGNDDSGETFHFRARPKRAEMAPDPENSVKPVDNRGIFAVREQYARSGTEAIYLDVTPSHHHVLKGESVEAIAKRHLGNGASATDVDSHIREIRAVNNIEDGKQPSVGATIILPGHNKLGDAIFKDYFGTRMDLHPNGSITTTYKDGSGYNRTHSGTDEYTDKHFGKTFADQFEVKHHADGSFERINSTPPPTRQLDVERKDLLAAISGSNMRADEIRHIKGAMGMFEGRAQRQSISASEVAEVYHQTARILRDRDNAPLTDRQRVRAAIGLMDVAAQPRDNDQGSRNTCNVTVVQNRLFMRQPADGAKLVADIATTGKYVAADGTTVFIDRNSIVAHGEEATNSGPGTNHRSYASQLFQVTAVNLAYAKVNEAQAPLGELRYEQHRDDPKDEDDTGERLFDYSTGVPQIKFRNPSLSDNQIMQVYNQIAGKNESGFFLDNAKANGPGSDKTNLFSSPQELEQKLKELSAQGKMPAIVGVFVSNPPFGSTSDSPAKDMLFDGHVVLAIDYDPVTKKVSIDNQWGRKNDLSCVDGKDHRITVDTLYKTTLHMPANEWLDRIESRKPRLAHRTYLNQLAMTIGMYEGMWKDQESTSSEYGPADVPDRDRARQRYKTMLLNLPPADRQYVQTKAERAKEDFAKGD